MPEHNHQISLADAVALTTRAREAKLLPVHAWRFNRGIIDQILAEPGVSGIRIYLGLDEKNDTHLVLVGTDSADNDLTAGTLAEFEFPCPPFCSEGSVLLTGL